MSTKNIIENTFGGMIQVTKSNNDNLVNYTLYNKQAENLVHIRFQEGPPSQQRGPNGVTVEDMINITIHRLNHLNDHVYSEHNVEAIAALNNALNALNNRTAERAK